MTEERDPMVRHSRFSGARLIDPRKPSFYHTEIRRGRIVLCGCARFLKHEPTTLRTTLGARRRLFRRWGWQQKTWGTWT